MAPTAKELIKRHSELRRERHLWEEQWQEIADHLVPRKNQILTKRTPGEKIQKDRFASTPQHAHEILTANMQGTLTSRAFRWFDLRLASNNPLNKVPEVRDWLQNSGRSIWKAINESNFHSQVHEFYLDLTAFGTSCIVQEEKAGSELFNGLVFKTYPIQSYVFEEAVDGMANAVAIEMLMTIDQMIERYGHAKVPKNLHDRAGKDPTKAFSDLWWVLPRRIRLSKKQDSDNMPFASVHISIEGEQILEEAGFEEFPAHIARWTRNAGERYGRGPGNTALPDIKVLNKATELDLLAWAKHIDPPWFMTDDGVVGEVNINPGKGTVLRDRDALWFFEFRGRADIGKLKLDELRQSIRQTFFADQLELPQSDRMTAEEIRTRVELMQRVLGPTLGRLETEFLNPLIERTFAILARKGVIVEPPEDLLNAPGLIDIQYSGPLARAERLSEVASIERMYATLANIEQVRPGVMNIIRHAEAAHFIGQSLDVPENLLKSVEEFAAEEQSRQQADSQAQQTQLGVQQSEIVRNLAAAQATGAGEV